MKPFTNVGARVDGGASGATSQLTLRVRRRKMKKILLVISLIVVSSFILTGATFGGSLPSAKSAVAVSTLKGMSETNSWNTIPGLTSSIKLAEWKDLATNVSLECGLSTRTKAKSKGGNTDSSTAEASVKVRVKVTHEDGTVTYAAPAYEDGVTFCKRTQTLTATFQGLIEQCIDEEGNISLTDECLEPEEVELILDTMNANAFNFLVPNVDSGIHTIEVETEIDTCTGRRDAETGYCISGEVDADAMATIGLGSMVVDEIRMTN
jgi:hypothetical protein